MPQTTPQSQKDAIREFKALLKAGVETSLWNGANDTEHDDILRVVVVLRLDLDGPDFVMGAQVLKGILTQPRIPR
jgi:hypothetical protein